MPVPNKRKNEDPKKFTGRCMSDIPKDEFPEQKQRVAICLNQNKKKPKKWFFYEASYLHARK